jgi:uncharacterized pyridoxal phosphate-containing UPF0001 family protein
MYHASAIPNLYTIQTLASIKAADAVNKALPEDRTSPLNVLLQVNTSGEDSKSGLDPLLPTSGEAGDPRKSNLYALARHIIDKCSQLRLQGLMTIGALSESLSSSDENRDFDALRQTRDTLEQLLREDDTAASTTNTWGEKTDQQSERKLLLSMGMSSDFEAALRAGSDIVRVGTGIFGARPKKSSA